MTRYDSSLVKVHLNHLSIKKAHHRTVGFFIQRFSVMRRFILLVAYFAAGAATGAGAAASVAGAAGA